MAAMLRYLSQQSIRSVPATHLIFLQSHRDSRNPAIYSDDGPTLDYSTLDNHSNSISSLITQTIGTNLTKYTRHITSTSASADITTVYRVQPRVALLCESDHTYITSLYGIWKSGCIAVPLCKTHPQEELEYTLKDSGASVLITSAEYRDKGHDLVRVVPQLEHLAVEEGVSLARKDGRGSEMGGAISREEWEGLGGMLVYTSGTTGRPKGVLSTHGNIRAQVSMLVSAWEWTQTDVILHCLPLHHVHGIVNALLCPLAVSAGIVMKKRFDPQQVWHTLLGRHGNHPQVSMFMGVPTMYSKLMQYHNDNDMMERKDIKDHCIKNIRLMVSGSAALSEPVSKKWTSLTGHVLLERYGMTEIGMCLSNPYTGVRRPGYVGSPLPSVRVAIQSPPHSTDSNSGTLLVKGPAVFKGYWGKPQQTDESFTDDGWFITGDTVEANDNVYKILGRTSVDIIKSSGYKISALEIERVLLEHPNVSDCAVFGVEDVTLGERVTALLVLDSDKENSVDLKDWCRDRLAYYKVPREFIMVNTIPRNSMGKVNKKQLRNNYSPS